MSVIVHVSIPIFYRFEGWLFEYDRRKPFGPWPCKKDFEPKKRAGDKFYKMFNRFDALSKPEQDAYKVID